MSALSGRRTSAAAAIRFSCWASEISFGDPFGNHSRFQVTTRMGANCLAAGADCAHTCAMTAKERAAAKAKHKRDRKRCEDAMAALLWSGWKLDIDVRELAGQKMLFLWHARRNGKRFAVIASTPVVALTELKKQTGAKGPNPHEILGTRCR